MRGRAIGASAIVVDLCSTQAHTQSIDLPRHSNHEDKLFALTTLTVLAVAVGAVVAQAPTKSSTFKAATASYTAPDETVIETAVAAPLATADPAPTTEPDQPVVVPEAPADATPPAATQAGLSYKPPVNPYNPSESAQSVGVWCAVSCDR